MQTVHGGSQSAGGDCDHDGLAGDTSAMSLATWRAALSGCAVTTLASLVTTRSGVGRTQSSVGTSNCTPSSFPSWDSCCTGRLPSVSGVGGDRLGSVARMTLPVRTLTISPVSLVFTLSQVLGQTAKATMTARLFCTWAFLPVTSWWPARWFL